MLKIKEAAEAMKTANKLATDAGLSGLTLNEYSYDDLDKDQIEAMDEFCSLINETPLFNELDEAGWQTSSIGC